LSRSGRVARRAWAVARLSLWLVPAPSRALRVRNNRVDAFCQRLLGRSLSSLVSGLPMLLLTTRGRRTGRSRTVALAYAEIDGAYLVVGGDHGAARDPQWVGNVVAHAEVSIELARRRLAADARVLGAAEADALWPRVAAELPTIELYRQRAPRAIPLVRIVPRAAPGGGQ
jgi:deazaflavin-dependent oxidoreductase (nitroreductase family)